MGSPAGEEKAIAAEEKILQAILPETGPLMLFKLALNKGQSKFFGKKENTDPVWKNTIKALALSDKKNHPLFLQKICEYFVSHPREEKNLYNLLKCFLGNLPEISLIKHCFNQFDLPAGLKLISEFYSLREDEKIVLLAKFEKKALELLINTSLLEEGSNLYSFALYRKSSKQEEILKDFDSEEIAFLMSYLPKNEIPNLYHSLSEAQRRELPASTFELATLDNLVEWIKTEINDRNLEIVYSIEDSGETESVLNCITISLLSEEKLLLLFAQVSINENDSIKKTICASLSPQQQECVNQALINNPIKQCFCAFPGAVAGAGISMLMLKSLQWHIALWHLKEVVCQWSIVAGAALLGGALTFAAIRLYCHYSPMQQLSRDLYYSR